MYGLQEGGQDGAQLRAQKRDLMPRERRDSSRRKAMRVAQNGDLIERLWNPVVKRTASRRPGGAVGMHVAQCRRVQGPADQCRAATRRQRCRSYLLTGARRGTSAQSGQSDHVARNVLQAAATSRG